MTLCLRFSLPVSLCFISASVSVLLSLSLCLSLSLRLPFCLGQIQETEGPLASSSLWGATLFLFSHVMSRKATAPRKAPAL